LPVAKEHREGVALCLSGGGFRAALFHLGAARRLNELGVLSRMDTYSAVSGGSIFLAFLADRVHPWPASGESVADWEERVARPFRAFTAQNLRTLPLLRRLIPWYWFNGCVAVEALQQRYHERVTRLTLGELPDQPRFIFSATDMAYGVNWIFQKGRVGDYQAGFLRPATGYPVARAVAASSCFPPVFPPMRVGIEPDQLTGGTARRSEERDKLVRDLRLTDGGVYDNMGLEPVWKSHRTVLVSDGGGTFDPALDKGLLLRLPRYVSLLARQSSALRKRWIIASFKTGAMDGTYWGVGSQAAHYDRAAPGYFGDIVDVIISEVRTDMDAFSPAEAAVLENHGYLLADAAMLKHAPVLLGSNAVPLRVPHPAWMDEERVRAALSNSHRVVLLGRWRLPRAVARFVPRTL
nr:patatin-like phospholipase family protein [Chloroflexota bacterium]